MAECPHKVIKRDYVIGGGPSWSCDWCGQNFKPVAADEPKAIEIKEPAVRGE